MNPTESKPNQELVWQAYSYSNWESLWPYADGIMLLEILLGAGLVVGAVVAALVYLDCVRRALPARSRLA